jgi:Fur family ferric uptake transcriptional regulator
MAIVRSTKQKRALEHVFGRAERPLSVEEAWAEVRRVEPKVALATVYRNVRSMVEDGQLSLVHFPGQATRYELEGKGHHHHFECRSCNRAFELSGCDDNVRFKMPRGFKAHGHEIVVYGLCAACAEKR